MSDMNLLVKRVWGEYIKRIDRPNLKSKLTFAIYNISDNKCLILPLLKNTDRKWSGCNRNWSEEYC